MIQVEEIRTVAELEKLRSAWDELAGRVNPSVFLSHGWFFTCATNLSASEELRIVLVRDGDRLIGIAPLMRVKRQLRRLPLVEISFLDNPLTPFSDFLVEDERAATAILEHVLRTGG